MNNIYCHACSKAGGAEKAIYHVPPECGLEHIPEYFDKTGVLEGLSEAHPVLLVRQMANEIMRLRKIIDNEIKA